MASCHLWTHPIGGEVRVMLDGKLLRSDARRDGMELIDLGIEWKEQF